MKNGDAVFGYLKNNNRFQGTIVEVSEDKVFIFVNRCSVSPIKVGKKYYVNQENIQLISAINYRKLSNHDLKEISICLGYKDLEEAADLNELSIPYETEPTKKQLSTYKQTAKKIRFQLQERIQSEFKKSAH